VVAKAEVATSRARAAPRMAATRSVGKANMATEGHKVRLRGLRLLCPCLFSGVMC
jgi:hypothetical protein